MKKQGANKGAITAFLISTPESGVDSIAVTYALLDPIMTVVRPVAAFVTAMAGGITENIISFRKQAISLDMTNHEEQCCPDKNCNSKPQKHKEPFHHKIRAGIRFALTDVWGDIAVWFFGGVIIAGAITALIPDELMSQWLGGGIHSMLFMLLFGIPLYICATASTPIAAALILKGVSPGAVLVFLLVGPATNITSLSVLIGILGKKSTIRYLMIVAVMAIIFGLGVDSIYSLLDIPAQAIVGNAGELIPYSVQLICALILTALSVSPFISFFKKKFTPRKNDSVQTEIPSLKNGITRE